MSVLPLSVQLMITLAFSGLLTGSPEELLRQSDVGAFAPTAFRARLVLRRPPSNTTHEIEVWRSGDKKTLIRFLDPRERGKYLLRLEDQLWFLAPGARKPVRMSPTYRLYGGITLDEVLGLRLAKEYAVESVSEETDPGGKLVVFELRARSERTLFPQIRYLVRESTARPVSAIYRLRSGRAATSVDFVEWNRDLRYARRVVVKDFLRDGAVTEVEVLDFQERQVPEGLFDLGNHAIRRSLAESTPENP